MSSTPVLPLLWTVIESILEVFILCVAGWTLARIGVVDRTTQKKMNRINVSLFTPCLLFSKVAFYLSPSKLRELWIIPLMFVLVTAVSAGWGALLARVFGLRTSQRAFAMAASMFMNSNSLPIALMQSLVITVPGLKWGQDDTMDAMLGRALTYLVVYSTLGMMLRWSYGVHLLSQADEEVNPNLPSPGADPASTIEAGTAEHDALLGLAPHGRFPPAHIGPEPIYIPGDGAEQEQEQDITITSPGGTRTPGLTRGESYASVRSHASHKYQHFTEFASTASSPSSRNVVIAGEDDPPAGVSAHPHSGDPADADAAADEWRDPRHLTPPTSSRLHSLLRRSTNALLAINAFMTVPMWASIASLVVACVQPLQHFLDEHARPVKGALVNAGNCSIPMTLVVLGAYFFTPPVARAAAAPGLETRGREGNGVAGAGGEQARTYSASTSTSTLGGMLHSFKLRRKASSSHARSHKASGFFSFRRPSDAEREPIRKGERTTVAVAVVSRMILTPAVLLPFFVLSAKLGAHAVFEDPIFLVSSVLLISSPPALTLAQITQAASGDAFERLISKTIFWSYCVFTPPLTILYVMLGMLLTKL